MRKYIRHPSDIPIEFDLTDGTREQRETLNDVSFGGLSFHSHTALPTNALVNIRVPFVSPVFQARAKVVWCRPSGLIFDIGVELVDHEDIFRTRMVEQICHIEHYKREILKMENRRLSGEEAALEWISKYAHLFPDCSD